MPTAQHFFGDEKPDQTSNTPPNQREISYECKIVTLLNAPKTSSLGNGLAEPRRGLGALMLAAGPPTFGESAPGVVVVGLGHSPESEAEPRPSYPEFGVCGTDGDITFW